MKLEISKLKPNKDNPRIIKDNKFKKLVQSIKEFPQMLELRPIVVDEDMTILGGNMRYKASVEAGLKEVYIKIAKGLTEDQKKEFIIKDNVGFGEWEWDILANEWDSVKLNEWGLDVWQNEDDIIDIEEINDFNESVNFIIKCDNLKELEVLQNKLNITSTKLNYIDFINKANL
jgi:hypothetical protein|tara:strand:+ start:205 stop:726 length:522 start_codon:yes stop_codon:yes gene_type:complete